MPANTAAASTDPPARAKKFYLGSQENLANVTAAAAATGAAAGSAAQAHDRDGSDGSGSFTSDVDGGRCGVGGRVLEEEDALGDPPAKISQSRRTRRKHHVSPHVPVDRDSLLHNVSSLPNSTFQGLANLGGLILFSATAQLIISNYNHRGIVVDMEPLRCMVPEVVLGVTVHVATLVVSFFVFGAQWLFTHGMLNYFTLISTYVAVQTVIATFNIRASFVSHLSPLASMTLTLFVLVLHLKLHSYVMTNTALHALNDQNKLSRMQKESLRRLLKRNSSNSYLTEDGDQMDDDAVDQSRLEAYPKNVTWQGFAYFLCVPSLVYEPVFPKRKNVRVGYLTKELVAFILCIFCIYVLGLQYIIPALHDDTTIYTRQVRQLEKSGANDIFSFRFIGAYLSHSFKVFVKSVFEVLHLSVPSIIMWLTGFYALFHCWLNFLSELTRYGDRDFYRDWWNAASLDEFWRKWNLITHEWLHRHIFLESLRYGRSKIRATLLTFIVSAVLHEYLFTLTFKSFEIFFAMAMVFQVPLIILSKIIKSQRWGNVLMWLSLFAGQPLLELLYMRKYTLEHPGSLDFSSNMCRATDLVERIAAIFTLG